MRAVTRSAPYDPEIEKERTRLEAELFRLGMKAPFPSESAIAFRNARVAELEAQLAALPSRPLPKPKPTGAEYAGFIVADTRMGDGPLDSRVSEESGLQHEFDPLEREYGH